ncbi:MAG: zinc-binding dehydrogenase [Propionibacteriaceae bacterium]|nr:zinc-binding dehydrogenase [Propionibacteriaceae bacterium]
MKALRINGPEALTIEDLPLPEPKADEVRLRMHYVGICGSDLNYYYKGGNGPNLIREPFSFGHEMAGIVDLDPSSTYLPGTPVTVAPASPGESQRGLEKLPHLWPRSGYMGSAANLPHNQGGASEYVIVKNFMIRTLPAGLDLLTASLSEPLAVALRALTVATEVAGGIKGRRILVSGSGPIGLLVAVACRIREAESVTVSDVLAEPLARARQLGITSTIQLGTEQVPDSAYDIVFECSGSPAAITPALHAARRAGTVCQVGTIPDRPIELNLAVLETKELRYAGAFRYNDEIDDAVVLLSEHPDIAKVITHVLPASEAVDAFTVARDSAKSGKVVVSLWLD